METSKKQGTLEVPDAVYQRLVRMLILSVTDEQGRRGSRRKRVKEIPVKRGA
jgi:hypothetical protein